MPAWLIPILIGLLQWLFSKDGPLGPKEQKQVTNLVRLARRVEARAKARGFVVPE